MDKPKIIGWALVILGFFILFAPYVSNWTGFFATLYAVSTPIPTRLDYNVVMIILGPILISVGYLLVRKKDQINRV